MSTFKNVIIVGVSPHSVILNKNTIPITSMH
jgi:hypothetical protein